MRTLTEQDGSARRIGGRGHAWVLLAAAVVTGCLGDEGSTTSGEAPDHDARPASAEPGMGTGTGTEDGVVPETNAGTLRVLRDGVPSALPIGDEQVLKADVVLLLASCTDRERRLVSEADWRSALQASRCFQLTFAGPRMIDTQVRSAVVVSEILVCFGHPRFGGLVLARSGETIYSAFTGADEELLGLLAVSVP